MVLQNRTLILLTIIPLILCYTAYGRDMYYGAMSDKPGGFNQVISEYRGSSSPPEIFGGKIKGGILPHHLLASWMIADFFEVLKANGNPKRIIVIGPDHFVKGISYITVGMLPYKTSSGMLECDTVASQQILKNLNIPEDREALAGEHSIANIAPFIKYYFPDSRIVPVMLQASIPPGMKQNLVQSLSELTAEPGTIVLLSMDFSHNHTPQEADRLDRYTRDVLLGFDYPNIWKADMDCHDGLEILTRVMESASGKNVSLRFHSNSAQMTGDYSRDDVTSYYTVFYY